MRKRFKVGFNIGKAKYVISHHDGREKHKDGSDFFGISIYKNQKAFEKGQEDLKKKGNPLVFVGDVVGTGSSRKSATNSELWHMGYEIPFITSFMVLTSFIGINCKRIKLV